MAVAETVRCGETAGLGGELLSNRRNPTFSPRAKSPYLALDRFLDKLGQLREGRRFLVTVDEFELIEEQIAEGGWIPPAGGLSCDLSDVSMADHGTGGPASAWKSCDMTTGIRCLARSRRSRSAFFPMVPLAR
jgi:hypothetical protein